MFKGQGIVGYLTGAEQPGRNWETKGWTIDANNELKFGGAGLQACPNAYDGGWRIWLQGLAKPGFSENCTYVGNTVIKTDSPISCLYTQE
jgi:hypothetical protein